MSANAHVDWAAAKRISLSTAGGANITIEGGNITVQCPGKITVHAGKKSFNGPQRTNFAMPHLPRVEARNDEIEFRYFTDWGEPLAGRAFKAFLSDGTTRTGTLDADGYARLSGISPGITARVEYQRDTNSATSKVTTELHDDVHEFFNAPIRKLPDDPDAASGDSA
jgi:type VI secretion system secreted protein VgrG